MEYTWEHQNYQIKLPPHIVSLLLEILCFVLSPTTSENKTVLLRERKRHTDRRLSSTPCAVLSGGGGGVSWVGAPWLGYPHPDLDGGTPGRCPPGWGTPPCPDLAGGVPPMGAPWHGYPCPDLARRVPWAGTPWLGYLPHPDLAGGYPRWVPPWLGYSPCLDLAGVPPPLQVWTDWKHYLPSSFGCGR